MPRKKTVKENPHQLGNIASAVCLIILILIGIFIIYPLVKGLNCGGTPDKDNPELYYYKAYASNASNDMRYRCRVGNHTENQLIEQARQEQQKINEMKQAERKACYDKGQDYNVTLDLRGDYGFTCEQIEYVNDHFILGSERKSAGDVEIRHRTFFTSHTTKVKLYDWVNTEYLATGKLTKNAVYHRDCDGNTLYWKPQTICDNGKIFPDEVSYCGGAQTKVRDTMQKTFYTEADFIMYYVDNCIGDVT